MFFSVTDLNRACYLYRSIMELYNHYGCQFINHHIIFNKE